MANGHCFLVLASLVFVSQSSAENVAASPIGKVVGMLNDMLKKGKAEKQTEEVEFAKFQVYCDSTRKSTKKSIETGAENILQLKATIGKALADGEELAEDLGTLEASVEKMQGELKTATDLRKKENTDYQAAHKDLSESVEAIAKATKVLAAKKKDVPQSLLELQSSPLMSAREKSVIQSFLALGETVETVEMDSGAPQPNAYEFQSGGVLAILEKLKTKFEDQRTKLEQEEASTKAAFELLKKKLEDEIKDGKKQISDKTVKKGKKKQEAAEAKGDLEVTTKGKKSDEQKLSDLNAECSLKSKEYDKNQVTRADEIKALKTAVEVMSSDTVSGTAKKHKVLLQDGATSLLQIKRTESHDEKRQKVAALLERKANSLGSKYLAVIAARALQDPMQKVKKMIKDLIVKLLEEANAEADQKGYCDQELAANKATRDSKTAEIDELTAEIEKLTADTAQLANDISDLNGEIKDLQSSMKKATILRTEEKATNTETISEAKAAETAVERAITVLRDFYAQAAPSFLQEDSSEMEGDEIGEEMANVDAAPYQGMQGDYSLKGGITGLLETILSDFAKLESSTSNSEEDAATKYEKFMNDSEEDVAVKGAEAEHMQKKLEKNEETLRNLKKELKATQSELDAALAYYAKLKPDCVDTGLSYQDRVEMRKAEILSLQEALRVLSE
jgi:hypothetical protein